MATRSNEDDWSDLPFRLLLALSAGGSELTVRCLPDYLQVLSRPPRMRSTLMRVATEAALETHAETWMSHRTVSIDGSPRALRSRLRTLFRAQPPEEHASLEADLLALAERLARRRRHGWLAGAQEKSALAVLQSFLAEARRSHERPPSLPQRGAGSSPSRGA